MDRTNKHNLLCTVAALVGAEGARETMASNDKIRSFTESFFLSINDDLHTIEAALEEDQPQIARSVRALADRVFFASELLGDLATEAEKGAE